MRRSLLSSQRKSIFGRTVLLATLTSILLLSACQSPSLLLPQSTLPNSLPNEADAHAKAHERSLALRKAIQGIARDIPQGSPTDLIARLRGYKREYFAVREILFETAMLNASAIVERPQGQNLSSLLLRTSLALMAGTALVQNFHVVAATLSENKAFLELWNEADPAYGIPEGSWDASLEAYRNSQYQDLFREAIERLKQNRGHLEIYHNEGDRAFLTLYPQGIDTGIQEAEESYSLLRAGFAEEDLGRDEKELRALVDRSKSLRSEWATSAPLLRQAIGQDRGLIRGNVHVRVQATKREYLDLREALYHLAFKHVSKLTRQDIAYPKPFRLRAIAISLLAAVTLYENAKQLETHILTIPGVRALLNQGDPALGIPSGFWDNIDKEFTRPEYRRLLEAGIEVIEQERDLLSGSLIEGNPFLAYVATELAVSTAIEEIRGEGSLPKIGRGLRSHLERLHKMGMGILSIGTLPLSKGFGTLVGVELRKGKLFNQPHWVQFVKERLEPGDLILEKSPFRLTDKFIPGHFGHVALYVGTEAELRDLGLLKHPQVAKYLEQVRAGKTVVEALPDGTQINTIQHALNTDGLAILRPKQDKVPEADRVRAIALAFSHLGKKYDFSFDSNTWDTIVCSELAFHTYVNVRWPFAKILSSYTITPDDIAVFAGSDPSRPFDLITLIHDGQVVHDLSTGVLNEQRYIDLLGKRHAEAMRYSVSR